MSVLFTPQKQINGEKMLLIFRLRHILFFMWNQFVFVWHSLQGKLLGNSYSLSLEIAPFFVTFVLWCCSQAEKNMPKGVLITHILALPGLPSGSSFKGAQQQNIFIPCFPLETQKSSPSPVNMITERSVFPLNLNWWSYFPTWSCVES